MQKLEGSRAAIVLPSTEMPPSLWVIRVMISAQLGPEDWQKLWWGKVLGYDGDEHLAAMEHKAGIEQVTGHRLESGCRYGSGHKSRFGY